MMDASREANHQAKLPNLMCVSRRHSKIQFSRQCTYALNDALSHDPDCIVGYQMHVSASRQAPPQLSLRQCLPGRRQTAGVPHRAELRLCPTSASVSPTQCSYMPLHSTKKLRAKHVAESTHMLGLWRVADEPRSAA